MKKKMFAVYAAAAMFTCSALAGCKKKGDDAVKLDSVSFSGVQTTYKTTDSINWSAFSVTFKYSDNSAKNFTADKMEFDVESPTKSETELLVKTEGLHALEAPYPEKRYNISVSLKEDFTKYYDAGSIAVGLVTKEKYRLVDFSLPRAISDLETIKADAGKDLEGAFKQFNDDFIVGTINPWKFEPVATFSPKDNPSDINDFTNYEKTEKIYVVSGQGETEISSDAYNRIKLGNGLYQFADEDAGKRFKIVVSPADFNKNLYDDPVSPVSFTFNVMKGYNVYNAKELGVLNLTNIKSEEFIGEYAYDDHYRAATKDVPESGNGQADVFLVGNAEKPYGHIDAPRVWEKFLTDNGILTTEMAEKSRDVEGVFLQNDIELTPDDIPSCYFINANDPINAYFGGINTGALRDEVSVYAPTSLKELTISGNYFKLDSSKIPLCKNTTDGSTCKALGDEQYPIVSFPSSWDYQVAPGHANLIKFCGVNPENDEIFYSNQTYGNTVKPATIKNLRTRGNTGTDIGGAEDDLEKKMKVTGLIFAKETMVPVTMDNLIIQEYMIGLFGDWGLGQAVPEKGIAQKSHTFIKNSKVFDCSNSGIFNYKDGGLEVNNTVMKRFGGACIINSGDAGKDDPKHENGHLYQANTVFTPDCEFENYVTGGEVYFAAVGASENIASIQGFNTWFNLSNSARRLMGTDGDQAGKMNLIALQMDGDGYVSADNGYYFAQTILNKGSDKQVVVEHEKSDTHQFKQNEAMAKTELGETFIMGNGGSDPAIQSSSLTGCGGMQGNILELDINLGSTILSCVFKLFAVQPASN